MSVRSAGSLRRRLLLWLLGPMLLLSTVLFVDAYRSARAVADRAYDRVIAASVLAIAGRVVSVDGGIDVDLPHAALEMLSTDADDRVFYRIATTDDGLLTGYADLPPPAGALDADDGLMFYDAEYLGEPVRVGAFEQPLTGRAASGRLTVQVAQTRGQRDRLVQELASATAARLLLLVVSIALATWLGVRFGLEPLVRLRAAVRSRSPHDLRPLDVAAPREVRDLVTAINSHMERLQRTLRTMEQFIGDAAHQLRTPLASLHTQVELALRETDADAQRAAIAELRAATWRTSRLAGQLLDLARSTAESSGVGREVLDLRELAAEVMCELAPSALAKDIDIGFEGGGSVIALHADAVLMQEMIKNLVDNAIRYSPSGATVTLRIEADEVAGRARLAVEDDGPGIPPDERARAFERFHRGADTAQQGSGLGLAIVREVVERHDGDVWLEASAAGGLRVRVDLPLGTRDRCL